MLGSLVGCSLWQRPPADLVAETDAYGAAIDALDGVAEAHARVHSVDPIDEPGVWTVFLVVTTANADGLHTVPKLISAVASPASDGLDITVIVPAGPGLSAVTLRDSTQETADGADRLRGLPSVASVILGNGQGSVELAEGAALDAAAAEIRASGALSAAGLNAVSVRWSVQEDSSASSVEVSMNGPSEQLLSFLENFRSRPDFMYIYASEPSELIARPRLKVGSSVPTRVADELAALAEDVPTGRPRTAFHIALGGHAISGYVGLPLGSPEPDDLTPVVVPDPAAEAEARARLAAYNVALTDFLLDAAAIAGVPAEPSLSTAECSTGSGSQVTGMILLPVFEVSDSAGPAYDAITASWEKGGYEHSSNALGTAMFTSTTAMSSVALATIRGTAEGIRVTAASACTG